MKLIFTDSVIYDKEIVNFFEKIGCKIIEIISELEDLSISHKDANHLSDNMISTQYISNVFFVK